MIFRSFSFQLWLRVISLILVCISGVLSFISWNLYGITILASIILIIQCFELHHFLSSTNRKLSHFLNSVQYSDFATTFTIDNKLGTAFRGLNESFNKVLESFRKTRIEKEEHLQYLNLVVEHVDTGLISFDEDGKIDVMNNIAIHLLGVHKIHHLDELKSSDPKLFETIKDLEVGKKAMYSVRDNVNLSIRATQFVRDGKFIKLIALQNIHAELAENEIDSWQNLLRVLRHEIMNSMTPISSLSSTMISILDEDIIKKKDKFEMSESTMDDLTESIETIGSRSNGLISFIQGYRDYTSLQNPQIASMSVLQLIEQVVKLMQPSNDSVKIISNCKPPDLEIDADVHMIEQVLINLVKNAIESFQRDHPSAVITIRAYKEYQFKVIEVEDNGVGIVPEAINNIFIPFYTNKQNGSGIGLSISKQIMKLHNGSLKVESDPNVRTVFKLIFRN